MKIGNIDLDEEVLIIAEVGNNHEGSYTLAEDMIGLAAKAGATAVKFQTIVPEKLVSVSQADRIAQLKKFQLSYDDFEKLSRTARQEGIMFLSTPFDVDSAHFLEHFVPAFKIASGDNNFLALIDVIARTGKPVIMSAGMTELSQTEKTKDFIESIWRECGIEQDLAVLHSVASYPTETKDANLIFIKELQGLGVTVGYSDHTMGIEASILSVAVGARVVEKHFTIAKNYSRFHDHQLSADPQEFGEIVQRIRQAEELLGKAGKRVLDAEEKVIRAARRSITARCDLKKGERISIKDIAWLRPGGGLAPGEEQQILGKRLCRNIARGGKILLEDTTV